MTLPWPLISILNKSLMKQTLQFTLVIIALLFLRHTRLHFLFFIFKDINQLMESLKVACSDAFVQTRTNQNQFWGVF